MNASTAVPAPGDASVVVRLRCAPELVELASDALWQAGTSAVSEEPADVVRGISAAESAPSAPAAVELTGEVPVTALADLRAWCGEVAGGVELEVVELDPAWADAWCEHARAYRVGPLVVRPVWVDATLQPGEIDLPLDPGPTFGSGSHPSTRGVLAAMVQRVDGGERVLDVGSGSGVLSVAALLLGADSAVAVDIEPAAGPAGRSAAALCGVAERFEFCSGGLDSVDAEFDVVFANMLIGAIEELGARIRARCAVGGTMILGGFLESQRDRALAAVQPAETLATSNEDGWVTLVARAPG